MGGVQARFNDVNVLTSHTTAIHGKPLGGDHAASAAHAAHRYLAAVMNWLKVSHQMTTVV
jgi:hypothetical protein